jgi:putative protein-disulfide isomerase
MSATLHYIYDPLCGWCYGAEPLVSAAAQAPGLALELHGGALWPEPTQLPEATRLYIRQADQRIAAMSGQRFGPDYHNGLLLDPTMVLASRPPTAAVLAAQSLDPTKALPMLRGIQHAHYEQGRRVVEPEVLADIAVEVGLDRAQFETALSSAPVDEHIDETHRLMSVVGAQGFPTFVLQVGEDLYPVPHSRFASQPAQFHDWLEAQAKAHAPAH